MLGRITSASRQAQRGLSLIELMVGMTVGLIVTAGAIVMMTNQVSEHRRLVLETQVQQDLRATADLMLRDLRRSGFWATPEAGVWAPGADAPTGNAYAATTPAQATEDASEVSYSYSRATNYTTQVNATPSTPENNTVDSNEAFGFRLRDHTLQFRLGNQWQPLTDPNTLSITAFSVRLNVQQISLEDYCNTPCPVGSLTCPQQEVRRFDISLTGRAKHDDKVVRTINVSSRARNDRMVGACPT